MNGSGKRTQRWLAIPIVGAGIVAVHVFLVAFAGAGVATLASHHSPVQVVVPKVVLQKLPDGCIQPQAAVDSRGVVHLVYFKGRPEAGDLYYVHYSVSQGIASASAPVRVNSASNSAMATGTIRTEQISIGKGDKLH